MGLEQTYLSVYSFLSHTRLLEYWKEEEKEGGKEGLTLGWGGVVLLLLHCIGGLFVCSLKKQTEKTTKN